MENVTQIPVQERALELHNKFFLDDISYDAAIKLALNEVDSIMEENDNDHYWAKVKEELNKL